MENWKWGKKLKEEDNKLNCSPLTTYLPISSHTWYCSAKAASGRRWRWEWDAVAIEAVWIEVAGLIDMIDTDGNGGGGGGDIFDGWYFGDYTDDGGGDDNDGGDGDRSYGGVVVISKSVDQQWRGSKVRQGR